MTVITIHCRLIAPESHRRQVWDLMALKNTPMINEILKQLYENEEIENWHKKGNLPKGLVRNICQELKSQLPFNNQPARFYQSLISLIEYMYKSYLAIQKKLRFRLQRISISL
ncbi:MAG: hypothetical protein ACXITR_11705 [Cyanobacterium sp.]